MTAYFSAMSNLHFISFSAFHIDPTNLQGKQVSTEASGNLPQCCQVDSSNSLQLLGNSDLTVGFSAGFYTMLIHPVTFEGQNKCWQWDDVRWGWCHFPCVSAVWFTFQSPLQATPTAQTEQGRMKLGWTREMKAYQTPQSPAHMLRKVYVLVPLCQLSVSLDINLICQCESGVS